MSHYRPSIVGLIALNEFNMEKQHISIQEAWRQPDDELTFEMEKRCIYNMQQPTNLLRE